MNDDEVWDAVKQTLSDVQMDRPVEAIEERGRARRRKRRLFGVAASGGLAAVAALALAVSMAARPGEGPTEPDSPAAAPVGAAPEATGSGGNLKLVSLADSIRGNTASRPGDASLIIEKVNVRRGKLPDRTRYHLYADSGAYYYSEAKRELPRVVTRGEDLGNAAHTRAVAAARYAATGDLTEARQRMINSAYDNGQPPSAAEQEKAREEMLRRKGVTNPPPLTDADRERSANNHLWVFSVDTLAAGGGHPEVRAGVLRLISTIPGVTVEDSTTKGQPTLTITAGPEVIGSNDGEQVLTINARNGVPISSATNDRELKTSFTQTFQVSRVTVADIKAGRF